MRSLIMSLAGRALGAGFKVMESVVSRRSSVGRGPFFDEKLFPWAPSVEADAPAVRAELEALLQDRASIPPLHEISADQRPITTDDKWRSFFLFAFGKRVEENCRRCPATAAALERIPGMTSAFFSILAPGKHIPEHRGPYNGVLRYHLGVLIPDTDGACRIRVGGETRRWREGGSLFFDDTFPHEAWNESPRDRVVLFVDFRRPLPFPVSLLNRLALRLIARTHFVKDALKNLADWNRKMDEDERGAPALKTAALLLAGLLAFAPVQAGPRTVTSARVGTYLGGGLGMWAPPEVWDKDLALARELGFGVFRFNSDTWDLIEPAPGRFDFSRLDLIVQKARSSGVEVLFTLPISSRWNRGKVKSARVWGAPVAPSHFPTQDLDSFRRLCRAVALRYRGRIVGYEVWNEPDFPMFWKGAPDAAEYLPFLKAAYEEIKAADPSALVLLGGLAKPADTAWFKALLDLGGGDYFERMNIHVYPAFATLDQALTLNRDLLKAKGLSKPFWITETSTTGAYFETKDREREEKAKADYLVRFFAQALSEPDVERVFWHTLRNPGRDVRMPRDLDFGLMTGDGQPLPALHAYKDFMSKLQGAEPLGPGKDGGYVFQRNGKKTRVRWDAEGRPAIEMLNGRKP